MNDIEIVRAHPEHAQVLTEIAIAAKRYWNYPESWMQVWIPMLTITSQHILEYETWMAVENDMPIAFYSFKQDGLGFSLDNLWVLPDHMGRGIGKLLFDDAVERCRLAKVSVLTIEADPNAVGFYEKMGACKIGVCRGEVNGEPRILPIMEIKL